MGPSWAHPNGHLNFFLKKLGAVIYAGIYAIIGAVKQTFIFAAIIAAQSITRIIDGTKIIQTKKKSLYFGGYKRGKSRRLL